MCGRFASPRPGEDLRRAFATAGAPPVLPPNWNVSPGQQVMVVRVPPDTKSRRLDLLRWGLIANSVTDLKASPKPINLPAETLAESPLWRETLARRRCIVPADAFYEWRAEADGKQPYAIGRVDGEPLAMAAIWERWKSPSGAMMLTFAILTTAANDVVRPLSARMPVILEPAAWPVWLGEQPGGLAEALQPGAGDLLYAWRVGPEVTDARNNGPELLDPVEVSGHS